MFIIPPDYGSLGEVLAVLCRAAVDAHRKTFRAFAPAMGRAA